jgi:hypothetical protein
MRPPRHPDWWHSWHRDFLVIGVAIVLAGSLLGILAVRKSGWIRWTAGPLSVLTIAYGFIYIYSALAP